MTRDSSGVMPSSLDVTFSIPAFTPLAPMPVSMSRMNSVDQRIGLGHEPIRPMKLEERRQYRRAVPTC